MKILLVDDHILFREGLASLLSAQPGLSIVGFANSVQDAITQTNDLQPGLVLIDFHLPDGNGLDYSNQILEQHSQLNIIFLTTHTDDTRLLETIDNSAIDHFRKNIPVEDLLTFIHDLKREKAAYLRSNLDK